MPMMSRECLALKFRQNWLAKHPTDAPSLGTGVPLDDSLTSLSWLQNLNIMKITTPTPPASPSPPLSVTDLPSPPPGPGTNNVSGELRVNPNAVLNMTNLAPTKARPDPCLQITHRPAVPGLSHHYPGEHLQVNPPHMLTTPSSLDKVDYKTNPYVKPPYSYATLICMAMKESKKNKITLAGIYNWIQENFMYYRLADPSWQNSIRHNLSLNKCFQKVPRRKDEPGKGGFWRINPEHSDMFVNGIFKKRRNSARENIAPPLKRFRRDTEDCLINGNSATLAFESRVKMEPCEDIFFNLNGDDASNRHVLTGDFNWNAILHQDIDVGGVKIKTEDILDSDLSEQVASPITAMSPPASDTNSDVGLDELLNTGLDSPLDLSTGEALDLTVAGKTIMPPEWWSESMTRSLLSPLDNNNNCSGLNTPIAQSPVQETDFSHPWAEHRSDIEDAMAAFDLDLQNLFEDDSLSSHCSSDS